MKSNPLNAFCLGSSLCVKGSRSAIWAGCFCLQSAAVPLLAARSFSALSYRMNGQEKRAEPCGSRGQTAAPRASALGIGGARPLRRDSSAKGLRQTDCSLLLLWVGEDGGRRGAGKARPAVNQHLVRVFHSGRSPWLWPQVQHRHADGSAPAPPAPGASQPHPRGALDIQR